VCAECVVQFPPHSHIIYLWMKIFISKFTFTSHSSTDKERRSAGSSFSFTTMELKNLWRRKSKTRSRRFAYQPSCAPTRNTLSECRFVIVLDATTLLLLYVVALHLQLMRSGSSKFHPQTGSYLRNLPKPALVHRLSTCGDAHHHRIKPTSWFLQSFHRASPFLC